jgi:predicted DsbA family dithiol-disulfide isomerase
VPIVATLYMDVICPFCALTLGAIDRAARDLSAELKVVVRPFETHPGTPREGIAMAKLGGTRRADFFREVGWMAGDLGIEIREPEKLPNSRIALEGMEAARAAGGDKAALAYARAAMRGYFGQGADLGDEASLRALGAAAGVDRDGLERWLLVRKHSAAIDAARAAAQDALVTAVPAGDVGGLPFVGHQTLPMMRTLIEKAKRRTM